jgi:hypothetical protein
MPNVPVDEGEPVDGTAPAEDEALVPDPQEEPPGSPQVGMLELNPPQSEHRHSPSPSQNDLDDNGNAQHMPDPKHGNEDSQQEDDNAAPGREAQPDDLPGGPNNWNPDDLVPHLDALRVSVDFIKGIEGASLDNNPLPGNIWEHCGPPPLHLLSSMPICECALGSSWKQLMDLRLPMMAFVGLSNNNIQTQIHRVTIK